MIKWHRARKRDKIIKGQIKVSWGGAVVKKREQVSERLQPEPRDGRKFKFKGIKGGKEERDYNMMRRQREGRSRMLECFFRETFKSVTVNAELWQGQPLADQVRSVPAAARCAPTC